MITYETGLSTKCIGKLQAHARRRVVPDVELRYKAELAVEINRLKAEKNAVILGHNYMEPALYPLHPRLHRRLARAEPQGRRRPTRTSSSSAACKLHGRDGQDPEPDARPCCCPSQKAGCSLAASITAADVRALKARFPGVPVVTYVNTYADVKAESDICCTSGNAVAVVESLQRRHGHLPAGRVPGQQRGPRDRQAHHLPVHLSRKHPPTPSSWTTR